MRFFLFALALLFYIYDYFIQVSPAVMTQQLMQDLAMGAGELGLLGSFFYYSYTLMQLPSGFFIDRLGVRKVMSLSALLSAIGVLLFSISQHFYLTVFSRLLIGAGSSVAFLSALVIVRQWFDEKYFPVLVGFIQFGSCIGSIFAEAPLAMLVDGLGWRQSMFAIAVMTFLLSALFFFFIKEKNKKVDQAIRAEIEPLMPVGRLVSSLKRLLSNKSVWIIAGCGFTSWVPVGVVGALWGVPYLMTVNGWTNIEAGKWCSLFWVGLAMGSPLVGLLSCKMQSQKKPIFLCFLTGFVASILLVNALRLPIWLTGVSLFLLGFMAAVQALTFSVVRDHVDADLFGTASGLVNMAAILGGGCAQLITGWLLHCGAKAENYTVTDYQRGLSTVVFAMGFGLVLSLLLQEKKRT